MPTAARPWKKNWPVPVWNCPPTATKKFVPSSIPCAPRTAATWSRQKPATFFKAYGLNLAPHYLARNADEAAELWQKIGGKAVMKIVSPDILHKTDAGGVALNIESAGSAREAFERLVRNGLAYKPDADIFGVLMTPCCPAAWNASLAPAMT